MNATEIDRSGKHRRLVAQLVFGAWLVTAITGCDSAAQDTAQFSRSDRTRPIKALCTTGMVADIVRNLGGADVQVDQLMGEGVDPHLYKASTGDVDRLQTADIVFYSGLHLEGKLADLLERLGRTKPVFSVTEAIPADRLIPVAGGFYDPHIWFDVSLWKRAAERVCDALVRFDPLMATDYRARAAIYAEQLDQLNEEVRQRISEIPATQRVLVTAHDAFHYFGRAYGLQLKSIQGISTDSEAGVKEINELVDDLVAHKIKAVFVETSVSERNIRALVEGCQSRGHKIRIGGELYSDALGAPGTLVGTYAGMVRHNVETIVSALQ